MEARVEVGTAIGEAACPLCRSSASAVSRIDPACERCGVRVHAACAAEMPGCPTLGCPRARPSARLRGQAGRAARPPMRRPALAGRSAFALDVADTLAFTALFAGVWMAMVAVQLRLAGTAGVALALVLGGALAARDVARSRRWRQVP